MIAGMSLDELYTYTYIHRRSGDQTTEARSLWFFCLSFYVVAEVAKFSLDVDDPSNDGNAKKYLARRNVVELVDL